MDNMLHVSSSPHIHSGKSTTKIMLDVLIALLPATLAGVVIFGLRALFLVAVCVGSCVAFEALYALITKKEQTVGDLSAVVTGLLLALNLPANLPIWQCVIGSAFAILLVKCLFGGIGCNLVNPAITARVFMLVSFGSMAVQAMPTVVDTVSGATPLAEIAAGGSPKLLDLFFGTTGGAIGETCALALLIGGAYLLIRRVITWQIPVAFVGSVFLLSFLMEGFDILRALSLILSGGLLLGAIFMATDPVTSPRKWIGKVIFGLGCGVITVMIRFWGTYPEGVSFAILIMNIINPYLNMIGEKKAGGASNEG